MRSNYLKIQIDVTDKKYGRLLGKRFSELSDRLDILTYESDEKCDVIVTDKVDNEAENVLLLNSFDFISPTSIILGKIIDFYENSTGYHFYLDKPEGLKTVYFTSPFGGSGTTSFSITFARQLAEREYKTIYISVDPREDWTKYLKLPNGPLKNAKKLEYLLSIGKKPLLDEFIVKDLYGIDCFGILSEQYLDRIIDIIQDTNRYDCIVVDGGSYLTNAMGGFAITILNFNDSRIENHHEISGQKTVYNMAPGNRFMEEKLIVYKDFDSFKSSNGSIDINMNGTFCQGVESIVKRCINDWDW